MQAVLIILLVVVYTCSDWLMDLRNRRKAFAREMAARQAHEHMSKYERLKQVKDTAKRRSSQLTRKLTRTLSRKQPAQGEELQVRRAKVHIMSWLCNVSLGRLSVGVRFL